MAEKVHFRERASTGMFLKSGDVHLHCFACALAVFGEVLVLAVLAGLRAVMRLLQRLEHLAEEHLIESARVHESGVRVQRWWLEKSRHAKLQLRSCPQVVRPET